MLGDDGRIRFPRALVEDMLAVAARGITLHGRDARHDMHLTGQRVHYGTAGAAVHVVEPTAAATANRPCRTCTTRPNSCDALDNIHFCQRPMVCRDIPDTREMDLNTIYACCTGTLKHVGTSFTERVSWPTPSTCCT